MTRLSWLHLTDLHRGIADQDHVWPSVENDFYEDLEAIHEKSGPWDLVLFTGDLTQRGSEAEFASLDRILGGLSEKLADLGSSPILLAVPGNHDLVRPADPADPAVEVLSRWAHHPRAQRVFWSQPGSAYRKVVSEAFAPYERWWADPARPFRRPAAPVLHPGMLPGEFSMVVEKETFRFGIVGLNSAFLHLEGGDYKERLALHATQLNAACGGNGPLWAKSCDVCLLLTHHPPDWLDQPSREQHYASSIAGLFAVHLHGHMHENRTNGFLVPGSRPRYLSQGCSLFGLESAGDDKPITRQHGYSAGRIEVDGRHAELRFWPRRAVQTDGGPWQFVHDVRFGRPEADQGTRPHPVEPLRRHAVAPPAAAFPPPRVVSAPGHARLRLQPPGNAYDPAWYVPRENEEKRVLGNLENDGAPATIVWGAPLHGKTWFLQHLVQRAREEGPEGTRAIEINLATMPQEALGDHDRFLRELGARIAREAHNEAWAAEAWAALPDNPGQALGLLLERHVLESGPRLLLVLENFHVLLSGGFSSDLFSLFRAWNQDASRQPWRRLRLLLGMSISPERFDELPDVSGFLNNAQKIHIGGFKLEHARRLRDLYGLQEWTDADLGAVLDYVKRHPYLVRMAMYECATGTLLKDLFGATHTANMQFAAAMVRLLGKSV